MGRRKKSGAHCPRPPSGMSRTSYGPGYGRGYTLSAPIWFEPVELIARHSYTSECHHHASLILRAIQWGEGIVKADTKWLRKVLPAECARDIPALIDDLLEGDWDLVDGSLVHRLTETRRREVIERLQVRASATKRRGISKKLRFEILKRSDFACTYCGAKAPDVELVIDHVDPVSRGGADEESNMVAACFDCNSGKGDRPIRGGV